MSAKHTPGPWEFIDASSSYRHQLKPVCIIQSGDKQVATFSWNDNSPWFPTKEQSQANARLIAAAPELLAAIQSLHSFVAVMVGRGPDAVIPETITTPIGVPVKIGEIMRDAEAAIRKSEEGRCS
jgi:hypothetical protein